MDLGLLAVFFPFHCMVMQEQGAMIFLYLVARSVCILKLVLNELEVDGGRDGR